MNFKKLFRGITVMFFIAISIPMMIAQTGNNVQSITNPMSIIGDWFAQIDIPQGEMTILMEMNILDSENCEIKCRWSGPYPTEVESGKAKYRLNGNQLVITFLNEEERIRTDNIFDMENTYEIALTKDKLIILDNRQFRNVDVNFGKGYDNRGFAEIIFPEDD